jgi:hypothetical protein
MTIILLRVAAWLSLLVIFLVTLGPIGLRPVSPAPAHVERFVAFLVVGILLALPIREVCLRPSRSL